MISLLNIKSISYEGKDVKLKGAALADVVQVGQKGDANGSGETAGKGDIEQILADAYAGMNRTDYGTNQLRADVQMDVGQWKKKTGSARAPPAKYSMVGRGENGLKTYKSDFSSDMTIEEKKTYMYRLITEAWDKKPIDLTILEDGKERKITARFDGEANGEKFAGKMAYGNRRGSRTERLITLNLTNDIWEIANESMYDNSKDGSKQTRVHDGTERWSYFTNAINYVDDAQPNRNGVYDFNLDVMRRGDGDFVYTFYLKKRRTDAPRTFTAGVDGKNAADVGSSKDSVSKTGETVKTKFSASAEQASEDQRKQEQTGQQTQQEDEKKKGRYRDLMGEKPAKYVRQLEARLVNELAENLSVPGQARREVLRPIAEDALRTFFTDGQLDRAKLDELFETAYQARVVK